MKTSDDEYTIKKMNTLVAKIYKNFSKYSIEEVKGVCTGCCLSQKSIEEILTVPLNELSWYAVYEYLDAAKDEAENLIVEAKYLLPRIIELFTREYVRQPSEYTFQTCYFDRAEYWSEQEIEIVREFAGLHFKKVILEKDSKFTLDELIIMWQEAGLNIDFLFDIWAQAINYQKAIDDYASMLSFNFKELNYESAWITCALAKQFTDWALSDEVFSNFSKKILIAVEDIDSLDEYQLDSYEYVLRLND